MSNVNWHVPGPEGTGSCPNHLLQRWCHCRVHDVQQGLDIIPFADPGGAAFTVPIVIDKSLSGITDFELVAFADSSLLVQLSPGSRYIHRPDLPDVIGSVPHAANRRTVRTLLIPTLIAWYFDHDPCCSTAPILDREQLEKPEYQRDVARWAAMRLNHEDLRCDNCTNDTLVPF